MEGDRSLLFPHEAYNFESSSNFSSMNEQNLLSDLSEPSHFTGFLAYSTSCAMTNFHGSTSDSQHVNSGPWNSDESSSVDISILEGSNHATKEEHVSASPLININEGSLSAERIRAEETGSSSLNVLNFDLNLNQVDNADHFGQTSHLDLNAGDAGSSYQSLEAWDNVRCTNSPFLLAQQALSSGPSIGAPGSSSRASGVGVMEYRGRESAVRDFGHLLGKRKASDREVELLPPSGNSSIPHNETFLQSSHTGPFNDVNVLGSSTYPVMHPPALRMITRNKNASQYSVHDLHSSSRNPVRTENHQRNVRSRINLNEHDTSRGDMVQEDNNSHLGHRIVNNASGNPLHQLRVRRLSGSASSSLVHVPVVAHFSQNLQHISHVGNCNSGEGSSSVSPYLMEDLPIPENLQTLSSINSSDPQFLVPTTTNGSAVQDPVNLHLAGESRSSLGNCSLGSHTTIDGAQQLLGSNIVQRQSTILSHRNLPGITGTALPSSSVRLHGNPIIPSRCLGNASASLEIRNHSGSGSRALQHASVGRHDHRLSDGPLYTRTMAMVAREGRGRMLAEQIRNVLDILQHDRNAPFENLLERSALLARVNSHDRYRDMRLDVDNMSYEELLALEERIGNVNTGLSEEKIANSLKQWIYVSLESTLKSGVEPCCICREEYADGEHMGRLGCGHEFHTSCIKKWLMLKNLCPICKKAAHAS